MENFNNEKVDKVIAFLTVEYPEGIQMFDCANWCGDPTETIYEEDGVTIDACYYYGYVEIFGLTDEEFDYVKEKCGY